MNDMCESPMRRITDKTSEIEHLIAQETDEKHRTLLLVVNSLNNSIRENTLAQREMQESMREHQRKLEAHLEDYAERSQRTEAYINQGKGAKFAIGVGWKIIAGLLMLVQALVIGIGTTLTTEVTTFRKAFEDNAVQHENMKLRISALEEKRNEP